MAFERPQSISVVIPAYQALPEIGEQLEALGRQDFTGTFEVIVADNGGSPELRKFVENHPLADKLALRYVDASDVRGSGAACNRGVREASMPFIAFCNQDDAVHPNWLSELAEVGSEYGIVGGALEGESLNDRAVAQWRPLPPPHKLPVIGHFLPMTFGCNMGMWRSVFEEIAGYDESFGGSGSGGDIDICWRAQLAGYRLGYAPDAVVAYRFRSKLRDAYEQAKGYGIAEARVSRQYADLGARGDNPIMLLGYLGWLAFMLPAWPWNWSRARIGQWVWAAGIVNGRLRGSWRYKRFYL
ncbi:glycosyltransferase [Skermania sp. ID1734]|nr:glycosyltransferase [Skermania sp. ID1734]